MKNKERRNQQTREAVKIKKQDPEWVEKERARQAKKKKDNPDAYKAYAQKRRSMLRGADGFYTASDVKSILSKQGGKCIYCKKDISKKYDVDHIIPLSKGGSNWPTNIQMLCPPCNGSKWAKCPIAFAQEKGMLL